MFFEKYKREVLFFSAACLIRVAVFGVLFYLMITHGILTSAVHRYPDIGADSGGYIGIAHVLLEEGRFASPGALDPQSYVMPMYPAVIAAVFVLGGSVVWVVILQALLAGASAVLIYRMGSMVSERVGVSAALLFTFDPTGIFYSTVILTETLFIFFLVCAAHIYVRQYGDIWRGAFISGIVLGIATLTRPSAVILPSVFFLAGLLTLTLGGWKRSLGYLLVFGGGFFLVVFPWMLRNHAYFDTWELTAVATTQWFQYSAPLYYAHVHGISHSEAYEVFRARLMEINPRGSEEGTLRNTPFMRQVVWEYLSQHPAGYAYFHAVKTLPFFFSDGLRDIARRFRLTQGDQPNVGDLLLTRDGRGLWNVFFGNGISSFLLLFGGGIWLVINICMGAGVLGLYRWHTLGAQVIVLSLGIVFATMLIAGGPNANARYRHSVSPFFFLVASYGFWFVYDLIQQRRVPKAILP